MQTRNACLANIILKRRGEADLKGLLEQVDVSQRDAVISILANEKDIKSNLESLMVLRDFGVPVDTSAIDAERMRQSLVESVSGTFVQDDYSYVLPRFRRFGVRIALPELVEAGYGLLERNRSRLGPRALIAAHENGELIDHARVVELAKNMYLSRGGKKFLRVLSRLKEGINLDVDVPGLLNEVGFSLKNFDYLNSDVVEMAECLLKLGHFNPHEFAGLVLKEIEQSQKSGNFYEHDRCMYGALKVLDSAKDYVVTKEFLEKVYEGFKFALQHGQNEKVMWFLDATDYFARRGVEPDMEGLRLVEQEIYKSGLLSDFDVRRLGRLHSHGYDVVPGLVEHALAGLAKPELKLGSAFVALRAVKELGGQVDAQKKIVDIGVGLLGQSDSFSLGRNILNFAKELYGVQPEEDIARLLYYSSK